jgi:hypothetical protein
MKIVLGNFNDKVDMDDIFKPRIGNEILHEMCNDNGVRVVNFGTSKNLRVKSTMFPHRNIHKFTWTFPDGKMHNLILIDSNGIQVYLMSDRSRQQIVILTTIWWWKI